MLNVWEDGKIKVPLKNIAVNSVIECLISFHERSTLNVT